MEAGSLGKPADCTQSVWIWSGAHRQGQYLFGEHASRLPADERGVRRGSCNFSSQRCSVKTKDQFFDKDKMPARTCVGVAALPQGADVEIECIADVAPVAR